MRSALTFILIIFFVFSAANPVSGRTISGNVVEKDSSLPVEFANVILLQPSDSTFVAGTTTDSLGYFTFSAEPHDYLLKVSFLGYETRFVNVGSENLGTITLVPAANTLDGVTVTASRPIIKMENGGISTDIQNSYLKNLGTAREVLGQLPFVDCEKDGITVLGKGKGKPLIYLNNRLVRDVSELDQLNSNQLKKVTVITNPGAEYDAEVRSVIRIETMKQTGEGLSGSLLLRSTVDKRFSHNETLHLNYRAGNVDVFGMFRYGKARDLLVNNLGQTTYSNGVATEVSQKGNQEMTWEDYRATVGLNYAFNNRHSAGIQFQKHAYFVGDVLFSSDFSALKNKALIQQFKSVTKAENDPVSNYWNAYYDGKLTDRLSVKLNMDYATGSGSNVQSTRNFRQDSTEVIKTADKNKYDLYAAKLILTSPLWQGELNYGYEFSKTTNKQHFDAINTGESAILQSYQNTSDQRINAAFLTYSKPIGKFTATPALRYENVDFQYFDNGVKEKEASRVYRNFFPSANVTYENGSLQMQWSYRNSTERPSYYQLRSEIQYDNPYSYEGGNPYLKPVKTNSLSYMLVWKDLQAEIVYSLYKDRILFVPVLLTEDIVFFQPNNTDKSRCTTLSATYSPTIKHWKPSLELLLSKDHVTCGVPPIHYDKPVFYASFKNNILLFKDLQINITFKYHTKGNSDMDYLYDDFRADLLLSKPFFNNKLRINAGADDIFGTSKQELTNICNNVRSYLRKNLNTQNISISISYDFNSVKSKYKGEQASDELNRL
ncbi:MAG: TonB-dependent receptor [Candidatus Azobacteroides sp.]|nr:TonB-dependent receptor [Candidatus Azobacteroides sp.]